MGSRQAVTSVPSFEREKREEVKLNLTSPL